jgi:hypothetical protein
MRTNERGGANRLLGLRDGDDSQNRFENPQIEKGACEYDDIFSQAQGFFFL